MWRSMVIQVGSPSAWNRLARLIASGVGWVIGQVIDTSGGSKL